MTAHAEREHVIKQVTERMRMMSLKQAALTRDYLIRPELVKYDADGRMLFNRLGFWILGMVIGAVVGFVFK